MKRKRIKRIISLLMCVALVAALAPAAFAADSNVITGEYTYFPTLGILGMFDNQVGTFHYSDDYFSGNGYKVTSDLAEISLVFTQASFGKAMVSHDRGYENQKDFLDKCGFTNYSANKYYTGKSDVDGVAVGCASKKLTDGSTLIAVGTRGHNYLKEWAGNVTANESGNWKGFQLCADQILDFTKNYITDQNITGTIKLWVIGYSRTAAAVNIVGGMLDNGYSLGNVNLPRENMYIYCFEPAESTCDADCHDKRFNNIHNFLNPADIVYLLPLHAWGFSHYGETLWLPAMHTNSEYRTLRNQMFTELVKIPMGPLYLIDGFQMLSLDPSRNAIAGPNKITQVEYFKMLEDTLAAVVPNRQDFMPYAPYVGELLDFILGNDAPEWGQAIMKLAEDLSANAVPVVQAALLGEEPFVDAVMNVILTSFRESGISTYDYDQVKEMVSGLAYLVVELVKVDADVILTLVGNIVTILNAHFTEVELAWIRSLPESYWTDQEIDNMPGEAAEEYVAPFTDVLKNAWYADAVSSAYSKGIMAGTSATTFEPDSTVTRAMVAQILYARAGKPSGSPASRFTDVEGGAWYEDAVNWAKVNGVVGGYPDGTFRPSDPVTREQLATILKADAGSGAKAGADLSVFTDNASISEWARDGMAWAVAAGLIAGRDNKALAPKDTATRAEVAQIMTNYTAA